MAPTFFTSSSDTTPAMMENSTKGTTIILMRFKKMVPKGLM